MGCSSSSTSYDIDIIEDITTTQNQDNVRSTETLTRVICDDSDHPLSISTTGRRNLTFEVPSNDVIPPVDSSIPHVFSVQQMVNSSIRTHWLDEYCPIGYPGRLVLGLDLTAAMMPLTSLEITGIILNVNTETENETNKLYLLTTNEQNELVNILNITYPNYIQDNGNFTVTLPSDHHIIEELGIGDRIGLYVVKSPYWLSEEDTSCSCSMAKITIHTMDFSNVGDMTMTNNNNYNHNNNNNDNNTEQKEVDINDEILLTNEQKWTIFVQISEDVISLLQTTFRTTEQRARLAVGSIFNDNLTDERLQEIFSMDPDDVYDASIDWLFTNGAQLSPPREGTRQPSNTRVVTFSSISTDDEPACMETPDTTVNTTGLLNEKSDNLPQPTANKRTQSSFDRYCCICFMDYDDRVMTHCHHFYCRGCIMDYIIATPDDANGCECPMCRRPVKESHLVSVPFGVAPSSALKSATTTQQSADRAGEIFVTSRSFRLLPPLQDLSTQPHNYAQRPCKSYLTLRVPERVCDSAVGLRIQCEAKDQGFALHTTQRSAILVGRFDQNVQLVGVALIGEPNHQWGTFNYDMPFVSDGSNSLGKLRSGDSLEVLLVTATVPHAKCYCRSATIVIY